MFQLASTLEVSYSYRQKIVLFIFCLFSTIYGYAEHPEGEIKSILAEQMLNSKQFSYLDKGGIITLRIVAPPADKIVFESLMRIESTDKERYNLILSRSPEVGTELLWVCNSEVEKVKIASHKKDSLIADTISMVFSVRFPTDSVHMVTNGHSYAFSSHGIRSVGVIGFLFWATNILN